MSRAHALYPNCTRIYTDRTYFKAPDDYTPLLNSFGTVLIRVDDDDCQGDSRILLHKDGRYGFLIFGWGSCSGCDALQDCDSYDDLDALIDQLENEIHWFDSIAAAHTYIIEQDTNGRNFYSHNKPKWKEFVLAVSDIAAKPRATTPPCRQAPRT